MWNKALFCPITATSRAVEIFPPFVAPELQMVSFQIQAVVTPNLHPAV